MTYLDLPWPTTVARRSPSRVAPRPRSGRGPAAAGAAPQPGTRCGRCARSLATSYAERKAVGRSSGMIHSQLKLQWMLDVNGGNLLWFLDKESKIVKFGFNSHGLSLLYPFVWYFGVKKMLRVIGFEIIQIQINSGIISGKTAELDPNKSFFIV